MKKIFASLIFTSIIFNSMAQLPILGKSPIKDVIKALTLEEKARLVMGLGMHISAPGFDKTPPDSVEVKNPVSGAAGQTYAVPRLGIPSIILADGPAGLRVDPKRKDEAGTFYATAFPIGSLMASTWNVDAVKKAGNAIGNEVKERGVDVLLAPALNLQRNVLGGRNFEYYSEDPLINGLTAAAYINGVQQNGVGTSIKHFVANNQEANRMNIDVQMNQRELRELYLKGFEIALTHSAPWTLMSSYNKLNGTYTSQDYDLLTTILKKEWNYKGTVMSDWFAGDDGAAQVNAGNDLIMPGTLKQYQQIVYAVKNGFLKESTLNSSIESILQLIMRTNTFKKYKYNNKPNLTQNAVTAKEVAEEGMVLLKNEQHTLPLAGKNIRIALFGNAGYNTVTGGTGSGDVNKAYSISIAEGLGKIYKIDESLKNGYINFSEEEEKKMPKDRPWFMPKVLIPEKGITAYEAQNLATIGDVAIIVIGRTAGEFADRKLKEDYNLSQVEDDNLRNISQAFHQLKKKVIVLLNIGGIIEMKSWTQFADAVLLTWQPGQEAGAAVADLLSGKVNPSGKLTVTIPNQYTDLSTSKGFPGQPEAMPTSVVYDEGIYVGYRYFEKYDLPVYHEFGYGLSYTTFDYGKLKLSDAVFKNKVLVSVEITNTGKVAGKEVVQLYLAAPGAKLNKPAKELKAYAKTNLLQPGGKQTVSFTINKMDLCSFNEEKSAWVADKGAYKVYVGASSKDIKLNGTFNLNVDEVVKKVNNVLAPKQKIKSLK